MGIEFNNNGNSLGLRKLGIQKNDGKLGDNAGELSPKTVQGEVKPVVVSVNNGVNPNDVLAHLAASASLNNLNLNSDKQKQAKLDNARAQLETAQKALQENTDPAKTAELQEAVDKALENYKKVIKELADAGYLETKTSVVEHPATKASGGGRTETEEIYENGELVKKTVTEYDSNGQKIKIHEWLYKNGQLHMERIESYDEQGNLSELVDRCHDSSWRTETITKYNSEQEVVYCKRTIYDSQSRAYVKESSPDMIGKDGEKIDYRLSIYDKEGNLESAGYHCGYSREYINEYPGFWAEFAVAEKSGDTTKFYDEKGVLVATIVVDGDNHHIVTRYTYDDSGNIVEIVTAEYLVEGSAYDAKTINRTNIEYKYNEDGSKVKMTTEYDYEDYSRTGSKIVTIENIASDGFVEKVVTEEYNESGDLIKSKTVEYTRPEEPVAPEEPEAPKNPFPGFEWDGNLGELKPIDGGKIGGVMPLPPQKEDPLIIVGPVKPALPPKEPVKPENPSIIVGPVKPAFPGGIKLGLPKKI